MSFSDDEGGSIPNKIQTIRTPIGGFKITGLVISIPIQKIKPTESHATEKDNNTAIGYAENLKSPNQLPPILVDKNNRIIDGNNRYNAASITKLKSLNCIKIDITREEFYNMKSFKTLQEKANNMKNKKQLKIKILTEKLEKETGKKVILKENKLPSVEELFDQSSEPGNEVKVNWDLNTFTQWCKQNKLKKQKDGKTVLWDVDLDGEGNKQYYVHDGEIFIVFEIKPNNTSSLFFS